MRYIKAFFRNGCIAIVLAAFAIVIDAHMTYPYAEQSARNAFAAVVMPPSPKPSFHYNFRVEGILEESATPEESSSPYFWLNSGGSLILKDKVGSTIQGTLKPSDRWRATYATGNALDTDEGQYPQNIFRLITKSSWGNFEQSLRFKILDTNLTETPNRGEWSGILLMSRYQDGDNLYYGGIRMDGSAVIKKKYKGIYYTLASERVFGAAKLFNLRSNPNLIPENTWMGLRMTVKDADGGVHIRLDVDENDSGSWKKTLEVIDVASVGGGVVKGPARAGIRTDYMDVIFDDYDLKEK